MGRISASCEPMLQRQSVGRSASFLRACGHQCDFICLIDLLRIGILVAGVSDENEFAFIRKHPGLDVIGVIAFGDNSTEHTELTGTRATGFLFEAANATRELLAHPNEELFTSTR